MFDHIDPRSSTPLYAQIADAVRLAIASGDLKPGDALSSVRQLATQLRVNPATVVQAYRDLETSGFVEMRQGAGTFVAQLSGERKRRERERSARKLVREMIAAAAGLGLSPADLYAIIREELERSAA